VDYFTYLLSAYGQNGIVLDTNILLLSIVGQAAPELLTRVKRTAQFDLDDLALLQNLLLLVPSVVTTPGILTESCNLLDSANRQHNHRFFESVRRLLLTMREDFVPAKELSLHPYFLRFGLADTSITHLAQNGHLVLTDDLPLKLALETQSLPVLNFNYLRTAEWIH